MVSYDQLFKGDKIIINHERLEKIKEKLRKKDNTKEENDRARKFKVTNNIGKEKINLREKENQLINEKDILIRFYQMMTKERLGVELLERLYSIGSLLVDLIQ